MHDRPPELFLVDILISINKVQRKTNGLSFEQFFSNEDVVDVTMRNLEIIGEATNQLLKIPNFLQETDVEWRKIVNFRNILAHFYFGIDFKLVFNEIIKEEVPLLEQEILSFMRRREEGALFAKAIKGAIADLEKLHHYQSIAYLKKIEKILRD